MFVTWSLWEAVRQVLALQLCLGEAVAACFCATRGQPRNQASRAVHCLLGHEGMSPSDLLAKGSTRLIERDLETIEAWNLLD